MFLWPTRGTKITLSVGAGGSRHARVAHAATGANVRALWTTARLLQTDYRQRPVNTGCCRRGPLAHVRRNRIGMEASRWNLLREVLFYIYHQARTPPPLLRPPLTSDLPTYHQLWPVCNRTTS